MLVFWWRGRGYMTMLIWLATMFTFGVMAAAGHTIIPDRPWYWGLGFVASAAINWRVGTRLNASSLKKRQPHTMWQRLFYRATHRFMSLPMETFSIALIVTGAIIAAQGATP